MKKFIISVFALVFLYLLFDMAYYRWSFYIPNKKKTEIVSYAKDQSLYVKENNSYKKIVIRGVNIGASIPGKYVTDYSIPYDRYLSWFKKIADMGANTVRVETIYNDDFYNALYDYNKKNSKKLYLIQGISLDTYTLNSHYNGYDRQFYNELIKQAENAVDVVHGRKKLTMSKYGKGNYKKDISDYVLGYVVGNQWVADTIIYTNNKMSTKKGYTGKYIKTTKEVTPYETMLAKVMDQMINYEVLKYHKQRTISFINTPETDPVTPIPKIEEDETIDEEVLYPTTLKYYYSKLVNLDISHLENQKNYQGLFASYNVSSYYPDYLNYEKKEYEDTYQAYLEKLTTHHKMPVVITEFAYSTSRGVSSNVDDKYGNLGGMTEEEQGESLVKAYQAIINAKSAGGIISTWQDEWDKRSWNTIEKVDIRKSIYWSDVQTSNQGLGILTFDPGKKESVCYVDGEVKEWKTKDKIIDNEDYSLSMKQDEKYLYFYVNDKKKTNSIFYIPIDITPKSGAKSSSLHNLTFNRDADFLLEINKEEGELFVQEYYNVLEAIDGYETNNKNSYENPPKKNSTKFDSIYLLLEEYGTNFFGRNYQKSVKINTGKLTYGNANPKAKNYNSQADFYRKGNNIEIRIPWQLLNFSDPSTMQIHDDYYKNYGVSNITINKMYVGISNKKNIALKPYKLRPWDLSITYHERLKKSYEIIKNNWRNAP